ncbi:MAG TPA: hypothetical protein VGL91_03895 [Acidobacteriota bacterium]|jgi:hypothetical protein
MEIGNERIITITLSESDWRAFLNIQPQPVAWLKQKIQEQLTQAREVEVRKAVAKSAANV